MSNELEKEVCEMSIKKEATPFERSGPAAHFKTN